MKPWMARHVESSLSTCTRGWDETVNIDVDTDSTAAIGMCSRTDDGKTRHIKVRWLWIQDAIRDKGRAFEKGEGHRERRLTWERKTSTDRHISTCCNNCSLKPTQCRRLLGLIATANGGSDVEVQADGDEGRVLDVFSTSNDCDTGSIRNVCDVEPIASGEVVQLSSSGEDC